jgi:hypothetical protein
MNGIWPRIRVPFAIVCAFCGAMAELLTMNSMDTDAAQYT